MPTGPIDNNLPGDLAFEVGTLEENIRVIKNPPCASKPTKSFMSSRWNPIVDRPIRFALVGCGRVAERHVEALAACGDGTRWAAICDIDPAARHNWSRGLDVPGYGDIDDLLRECSFDVAVLATPSGLHPEQAIRTARAGRHVLTEKPMATRWSDGQRMVRACDENDVGLFVVKQHRYNPAVLALKEAIEGGRFGRIYSVQLNLFWARPQSYYDMAEWRGTWELDGGALMNQAIHYIDLLQWLVGPVESVHAFTSTLARRIEVEDTAAMNLRWRCGALGSVTVTMLTFPQNYEGSVTIIGEHGTVRLGGVACDRIDTWRFREPKPQDEELELEPWQAGDIYGSGHVPLYRNVVGLLRGTPHHLVDGHEGLKSLEIVIAAYRSAQEARRVSLPLDY